MEHEQKASGTSMAPNVAAALSYLALFVTGIIFLLIEKENDFVRFHAMQSVAFSVALFGITLVLGITIIGAFLIPLVQLAGFVVWIVLMWKAYNNEKFMLPVIGQFAEKNMGKIK